MAQNIQLTDGTINWSGGFDTSRSPIDIGINQYAKGVNVIIPDSGGGLCSRYGIHCLSLKFENNQTKEIYRNGSVQAEGWFVANGNTYLVALVDGYVFKFSKLAKKRYEAKIININDRNSNLISNGWIIQVPDGCIVNNGIDYPLYVTETTQRRTNPSNGEIGIGRMGVYLQNRLFYVDQSGKRILASDIYQPFKFTLEDTNIYGFQCPDQNEEIVAIAKQKSILGTVEGGNLIWSSNRDIYSADVRGTRSTWADLGSRIGKVTETIPGFSACSSYSFENYNTNIYFRSMQFGMADIRQSQYQFTGQDALNQQSIEAAAYFDHDTEWMLNRCYTRSCNNRLFTTITPKLSPEGSVYWNGILSYSPAAVYSGNEQMTRRFESVFTGIQPWCLTVTKSNEERDQLFIHSRDRDGITRLYLMDQDSDHDINSRGDRVEIEGIVETRAFNFQNPFVLKKIERRLYRLSKIERTINIKFFSKPELFGPWIEMWDQSHKVCRARVEDGLFIPQDNHPQTRAYVVLPQESFDVCYPGLAVTSIQYRIEFKGPLNLEFLAILAMPEEYDCTTTQPETECSIKTYTERKDYTYSISN